MLTSLPLLSDYNCLHTPSWADCWQNPFRHLWALSLEKKQWLVPTGLVSLGQGLLETGWQKPSFLFPWGLPKETHTLQTLMLLPLTKKHRLPKRLACSYWFILQAQPTPKPHFPGLHLNEVCCYINLSFLNILFPNYDHTKGHSLLPVGV